MMLQLRVRSRTAPERSSLTALAVFIVTRVFVLTADASVAAPKKVTTRLFLDWAHVHSGRMEATFDRELISRSGWAAIDRNRQEWNIQPDLSGHGMKRNRLPSGIRLAIEPARKSAPWLVPDQTWEKQIAWVTVIHEKDRYRCWYWVFNDTLQPGVESLLCYAESADGVDWLKPALEIHPFPGMPKNNIVSLWNYESAVFLDESARPAERYKAFVWDKQPATPQSAARYGLYGVVSPDGYHWTRLPDVLLADFHDTQNILTYDKDRKKYIAYLRGSLNGRSISYAETDDFHRWPTRAEVIASPGPLDAPDDDYYTNGFTLYPDDHSLRLIFASIYHHSTDLIDVRLGTTRNGRAINWVSYEPIVRGGKVGDFDAGGVLTGPNLVRLPDQTLALPYRGMGLTHNEWLFTQFYHDPNAPTGKKRAVSFAWAIWDDGRLAGIEAENLGEFWTREEKIESTQILVNARTTPIGSIAAELWEPISRWTAQPVAGFSFEDCVPFNGDEKWVPLRWRGKTDLSELKGKSIQVRFRLNGAKVFGFRLAD